MFSMFPSEIDISQYVILRKMIAYLQQEGRDQKLIDKLSKGYCNGFATVACYAQWLQSQPQKKDSKTGEWIARDDWTWFFATLQMLATWDENSSLLPENKQDIERLLALLEYFQYIFDYLPIAQGELQDSLQDTQGRHLTKEYSLAGLFTEDDLKNTLQQICPEGRLLLINSHNHCVSLLRYGGAY